MSSATSVLPLDPRGRWAVVTFAAGLVVQAVTDGVLTDSALSGSAIGAPRAFADNVLGVINQVLSRTFYAFILSLHIKFPYRSRCSFIGQIHFIGLWIAYGCTLHAVVHWWLFRLCRMVQSFPFAMQNTFLVCFSGCELVVHLSTWAISFHPNVGRA